MRPLALSLVVFTACSQVIGIDDIFGPSSDTVIRRLWEKRATIPDLNLNAFGFGYRAIGFDSRIYFGPESPSEEGAYWRWVDVLTGDVSASLPTPPWPSDFEAGGYTEVMAATPTTIYMFGNAGMAFSPETALWTEIASYQDHRRGEAAIAYDSSSSTIIIIGGRGRLNTASRFNPQGNTFSNEAMLPLGLEDGVAYTPSGDNKTYLAGGRATDSSTQHLLVHETGSNTWSFLPDAPEMIRSPTGMGHCTSTTGTRRLFVTNGDAMYFFNLDTNSWDLQLPIPPSLNPARSVMVDGAPHVMVQNGQNAEIYKLLPLD